MFKLVNIIYILVLILNINNKYYAQNKVYQQGIASYYAERFNGKITASGEIYQPEKLTAAHESIPFGSFVKIINLENNQSVVIVINDRGPYIENRIIDVSKKAATKLGFREEGTANVSIEIVEEGNNEVQFKENDTVLKVESGKEYYKLFAKKQNPAGYGIQIASYAEIANLMEIADKINAAIKKDLIIQIVNYQDNKVYRLIIGSFKTKDEANKFRSSILEEYQDCFIIKF